ncbi:hypothetical protein CFHF_03680 [Caulobacter flavus]|uniref:Uncharacterized protein n=1 Tax=Caulobacter flavus TaxID=1679497 RepID=A0A2N5CZ85_9CAUL|nr:hypothetical protein [Caulobacter flavus]AYV45199.1 hypothetical protein C1707_02490 [Caulobacter flavus]PLR19121.1 hypothetical protein CFHF_03680 [Caulobacter flavus]
MSSHIYLRRVTNTAKAPLWLRYSDTRARDQDVFLPGGASVDFSVLCGQPGTPLSDRAASDGVIISIAGVERTIVCKGNQLVCDGGRVDGKFGEVVDLGVEDRRIVSIPVDPVAGPDLAACAWLPQQFAYFGLNRERQAFEKACVRGAWGGWRELGGPIGLTGRMAAVSWAAGRRALYALDQAGRVHEEDLSRGREQGWAALPHAGTRLLQLSAVSWAAGRYGLYAVGEDGKLHERWWAAGDWKGWNDLGAPAGVRLTGPVTAVDYVAGRYALYAAGSDGHVWERSAAARWGDWTKTPFQFKGATSLASGRYGPRKYVVGAVVGGEVLVREYAKGWKPERSLGHPPQSALAGPLAIAHADGALNILAAGVDGAVYLLRWAPGSSIGAWTSVEGA